LLAYGLGRVGCQVSGDGDWGIINQRIKPFSWMPDWLWAYDYAHNVNGEGVLMTDCDWGVYCTQLQIPVYPTPLYEIIIMLILFAILWSVRKKFKVTGRIFSVYLVLNGLERFFIEKIRVNSTYNLFGFHPTQAEIISTFLVLTGIVLYILAPRIKNTTYKLK